jgi:NitT/TauT family transport system substrate-binding protein
MENLNKRIDFLSGSVPKKGCWENRNIGLWGISILVLILVCLPCGASGQSGLKKATFVPHWVPQAQFAGYYVAQERGFYKKEGIDLAIIAGGPHSPPLDFLKEGKADLATLWLSTGIQARAQGVRLVNIAQILQKSALMLVAKKANGISVVQDLDGRKVGLWEPIFQIQPGALFRMYRLNVKVIPQSTSVDLFLRNGVDAASAMWYNEYHTILNFGVNPEELTPFFFHEHGLNFPEDGIYVMEKTLQRDPELCLAFVKASIEGWQYAFAHPEETLDVVMRNLKREHIPATRVHQKWMLARMKDLILSEGLSTPMGRLVQEDYDRVARGLQSNGLIERILPFHEFYKKSHEE